MKTEMTEQEQRLRDKLLPEIEAFKQQKETLQLATVDIHGQPNASYAPLHWPMMDFIFWSVISPDMAII